MIMKVLVACEFSGRVRDAFISKGHDAISCDLLPTESDGPHIQGDVLEVILKYDFDLIVAHPPCTYLCNSGVTWLYSDTSRMGKMKEAAKFFKSLLYCKIPRIAVENPIMHSFARELIPREYDQIVQPWWFGEGETKATCLWLKGLPKLTMTNKVWGRNDRLHRLPPSKDRGKQRSVTYLGIAKAMADQWSSVI